jgi:ankyrin repeat protein
MSESIDFPFPFIVHDGAEAVVTYLASGGDVNRQDFTPVIGDGRSMLHEAAAGGLLDIVKLLIEHGANVNLLSLSLQSPLWEACNAGQTEVALYLISAGANVNSRNVGGYTPYGRVLRSEPVLCNVLLAAGAIL